jgi:hypothetical protein
MARSGVTAAIRTQAVPRRARSRKHPDPLEGRPAMNLTPEQIQEHVSNLSDATVEDLDDLLHDLCCMAWPTTDGQNN